MLAILIEISAAPRYELNESAVVCLAMPLIVTPPGLSAVPSVPDTLKHVTLATGESQLA
ncbi:hypothetical protein PPTG_24177 [Phytophthora nicotianae INRA-310]|uniref:Uncharacterized protein n=1 Tax=Phytophthora nicotianae (strain INRA-310) TaxID=761204 RepID=W2PIY1_PHYN3|nr:hypothetical protein PPTG_24177 [Phytophthora nicotianae INRA-310]ETN00797.1 hypothetical protein PPTG_24177 [Phytophthora nicotianae INRA-310]